MSLLENLIATTAATSDLSENELLFVFSKGERKFYGPGEYLFHEGTPNFWAGIIEDGIVELVRERNGVANLVAVLSRGATIAEEAMLGDFDHTVSAFSRTGVTVWQVPCFIIQTTKQNHPDIYFRLIGRVAQKQRFAAEQLALTAEVLRENRNQVLQEGWLSKESLEYILK